MKILLIDNYDSFTYILKDYIEQCGVDCRVIRNDEIGLETLKLLQFDAIVISPGPKTPAEAGFVMALIGQFHRVCPILGICLGHQALAQYFGATIVKAKLPRHGKVDPMRHTGSVMFKGIPATFQATRYHSLVAANIPAEIKVTCTSGGEVMAIEHELFPLYGIQFHPESCQTEYGLQIIKNFIDTVKTPKR